MIDINFYCQLYENSKGLAIIQNFTAHWGINNKEMTIVWIFDSVVMQVLGICDSCIISNFKTFAICLYFIIQQAVKS